MVNLQNGKKHSQNTTIFISYEWMDHIAVYNYMFRPLSAIVRLYLYLYSTLINYSNFVIYKSCEQDLVTNNRHLPYCVVLLYNKK